METTESENVEQTHKEEVESVLNTDNLPLTSFNDTNWINNTSPIKLNTTPTMTLTPDKSSSGSRTQLPNTDNLLDISLPKTTLLGKEQAKKRLYAFSMAKQTSISPVSKKPKTKSDERHDHEKIESFNKKLKKALNPDEKAKAVIEEIEEIKKIEHAYHEALEKGLLDPRRRRSRSRSQEWNKQRNKKERRKSMSSDNTRYSKSLEKCKYPENWTDVKDKGYDRETIANMRSIELKKLKECSDFRMQFLFQTPSLFLHPFIFKDISGKEKIVPILSRRATRTKPKIFFNTTDKVEVDIYSRNCILEYVPKLFRENILKVANYSEHPKDIIQSKSLVRKWYPKTVFSNFEKETECTILENSLGLSFLQNYSDEDEQDKEETEESNRTVTKIVNKKKGSSKSEKKSKIANCVKQKLKKKKKSKKLKKNKIKRKEKKKKARAKKVGIEWLESNSDSKFEKKENNSIKESRNKSKKEQHEKKLTKSKKVDEKESDREVVKKNKLLQVKEQNNEYDDQNEQHTPKLSSQENKIAEKTIDCKKSPKRDLDESYIDKEAPSKKSRNMEKTTGNKNSAQNTNEQELDTPDTDEYYSNWESEDEILNTSTSKQSDLYTDTSGVNLSWESDNDIPLSKSPVTRYVSQSKSPSRNKAEEIEYSAIRKFDHSPNKEFSPFRNRSLDERRKSRCSLENASPSFLEMPLTIRNFRTSHAKSQWEEDRQCSESAHFQLQKDSKCYSLYTEDSWEKDDYLTIRNEELRLEEERRTLMEERRQLEIEKRKLEELERQRYYFHRSHVEDKRRSEQDNFVDNKDRYYKKSYQYPKEEFRKVVRQNSSEPVGEIANDKLREESVWEENTDEKRYQHTFKRKKIRWHNIYDPKELEIDKMDSSKQKLKDWEYLEEENRSLFNKDGDSSTKVIKQHIDDKPLKDEKAQQPEILENEYEKFMEALGSQIAKEKAPEAKSSKHARKKRQRKVSTSSSSSSSSSSNDSDSSSSSTSSSSSSDRKRKKLKRKRFSIRHKKESLQVNKIETKQVIKIEDVERGLLEKEASDNAAICEISLPHLETCKKERKTVPLPVPSPQIDPTVLNTSLSNTISIISNVNIKVEDAPVCFKNEIDKDKCQANLELNSKLNNSIPLKLVTPELRTFELTNVKEDIKLENQAVLFNKTDNLQSDPLSNLIPPFPLSKINESKNPLVKCNSSTEKELKRVEEEVTTSDTQISKIVGNSIKKEQDKEKIEQDKGVLSPIIGGRSKIISKKKDHILSPKKEHDLGKINLDKSRNSRSLPKSVATSPKHKREKQNCDNVSPKADISRHLNQFTTTKTSKIQETLHRISTTDKYSNQSKSSPLSSPLDGFKRSVADSTISDEQLLQSNLIECTQSSNLADTRSPRRMSLDERINQELGISEEPKPISTTYSNDYDYPPQYFEEYGQYFNECNQEQKKSVNKPNRNNSSLKVLQVGNILQVVPTEDFSTTSTPLPLQKKSPIQQNMVSNSTQKILQVGNMLQIVPSTESPENFEAESKTPTPVENTTSSPYTFNAEILIKQKAQRRAEKDKRKQERQLKRKEKEKKRKERERRKQLKVKLQTEAMIKQALILEDAGVTDEQNSNEFQKTVQWPPIPQIVFNSSHRPPGKGILCQSSNKEEEGEEVSEKRKQVKFADGVRPGEGTSPSGGEELSSPPPAPRKLPKEKRFKKTKLPKKDKVPKKKKVKVIRQQMQGEDENEEDNLPPPPPPPGSPPPHIFPARIKIPVINNIHSNILATISNPPMQTPDTSYPPPTYRANVPVIISHHSHIPLHPPGPPPQVQRHHLPPLPTSVIHRGSFNQSSNVIPHSNRR